MFDIVIKALDALCSFVHRFHCFGSRQHDVRDHLLEQGTGIGVYRHTVICGEWEYKLQPSECWKLPMAIESVQHD
ncbi:hypothetical protein GCK32_000389 [Trichostrongylus colubriformis]|uniref:Uncharacterized protein n=1 Tax=Trichostrongylus colubriformis TaxID=6319 RepID=A0AAN8FUR7_TRICO